MHNAARVLCRFCPLLGMHASGVALWHCKGRACSSRRQAAVPDKVPGSRRFPVPACFLLQALERLELGMQWPFMGQFWPAVCRFPRLRELLLIVYPNTPGVFDDPDGTLDGRMLAALSPSLEHLTAEGLKRFEAKGPGLLPSLKELHVRDTERVVVNAALPGLKLLGVQSSGKVWLRGASLALPQLTRLWLGEEGIFMQAQVDFPAMPVLAELSIDGIYRLSAAGGGALTDLSPLQHLTLLTLGNCKLDTALGLLHLAPPTLPGLDATACYSLYDNDAFGAALGSLTQLTRLHLRDASLAARLEQLQELRELHLDCYAEPQSGRYSGVLREQDIAPLGRLRNLRRLRLEILPHHQATEEQERRLQVGGRSARARRRRS